MDSIGATLEQVVPSFTGQLLREADADYDEARRVHNGLVDKRPAVIARCCGVADVSDAVMLARTLELEVAVKGGGHNVAGRGTIDGGMMVDLSLMRGIHVEPGARTVRAQGGVLWKEFNRETQLHGLATTGGVVSSTGIAGLTLGGGIGWLMPKYGLALDNLRAAELVMADGRVLRTSEEENPDLFWAIRGGGGNFGIATSLEFTLHEVGPLITGGLVAHPIDKAGDVLRRFRERCESAPDELMLTAGLLSAPDSSAAKLVGVIAAHCGSLADGEAAVRSLKTFGSPVLDTLGPIDYCDQNQLIDATFPKGTLNYWKSHFLTDLTDDAIQALAEDYAACSSPLSQIVIEHCHGAAARVPVESTACAMRLSGYNVAIISQWTDPHETERCIAWCQGAYSGLESFRRSMRYVNYLDADDTDAAQVVYGPNYTRLREIKAKYDPENFFHVNVNITPTASDD